MLHPKQSGRLTFVSIKLNNSRYFYTGWTSEGVEGVEGVPDQGFIWTIWSNTLSDAKLNDLVGGIS